MKMNQNETVAALSLVGLAVLVGYMDFFHKWPDTIAFVISSSGVVYTIAYIIVVMIKTSMPVSPTTLKAAAIFFVAVNVGFKLMQSMETSKSSTPMR